ncbi:PQQ-like beta-propeller repeat protein [Haladaptatus halobius]|uniref:PQQ-like beta-propeller repeat protein n=1 Tax=Haladaptatus halobius TaxID=2884875 RepID=UPI001D0BC16F|nr:PQQ-binding-like beta-propeller repeat protein [Haladaptatus halobius]
MLTNTRRTFSQTIALTALTFCAGSGLVLSKETDDPNNGESPAEWPTYRSTVGRTGATTDSGPASPVTTTWTMDLKGGMMTTEPVVADGTLYLAVTTDNSPSQSRGYVAAYDSETGDQQWIRDDVPGVNTPTVAVGTLYVATNVSPESDSEDGGLIALDRQTGETTWQRDDHVAWADPILVDDRVYTVKEHSPEDPGTSVQALDASTGDTVWQTADVQGDVCYADGTVFTTDGTALNAADGTVLWSVAADGMMGQHVIQAVDNGLVYGVIQEGDSNQNVVQARSPDDGSVQWSFPTGTSGFWAGRLTVGAGHVFFRTTMNGTHAIRALDAKTGEGAWSYDADTELTSDLTVADGILYAGGRTDSDPELGDAVIVALDAAAGEREWDYIFGRWELDEYGPAANAPIIANGRVYTATYPKGSTLDYQYTEYGDLYVLGCSDSDDHVQVEDSKSADETDAANHGSAQDDTESQSKEENGSITDSPINQDHITNSENNTTTDC